MAILADPIHQVKTPQCINELLRAQGVDAAMVPLHVGAHDLATVFSALRRVRSFAGCIVTMPHKTAVVALCDELSVEARQTDAVNAVRRLADGRMRGGMLDGIGFIDGLRRHGIEPAGHCVYLAGAGGAARAIAFALADAGARRLTIANRSVERAEQLVERVRRWHPNIELAVGDSNPGGHALVVNATSLGLRPEDPLPMDVAQLDATQTVAEIIMEPAETALMQAAWARGCRVHAGAPMLAGQARLMAEFMLGQPLSAAA
nr:shikimate dehydrogenase [Verminephrobacter aporrectodeae]